MNEMLFDDLPPLQGCLYCHTEGSTILVQGRKIFGIGGNFPRLKCDHCHSVALFDYTQGDWRINYRRVNQASRYYYVSIYLGQAGWLIAQDALRISTNGYVQRMRAAQSKSGDLAWLRPTTPDLPLPQMTPDERVYLTLRAVTLHNASPWNRAEGAVVDSGKFHVTDDKVMLIGQRREWFYTFDDILRLDYNRKYWTIYLDTSEQARYLRGMNARDQLDAQLVTAVVEALSRKSYEKLDNFV